MNLSQSFADTNTGRKRRHNEDSFVWRPPLFAVADGMGGAQAGEVASGIAADTLRDGTIEPGADGQATVVELIQTANRRVYQRAHDDATASGMGTTMTAALFQEGGVVLIGHVGDSRAYVLRDGRLEQLTEDHSLVAELVRRGELSPEEAELHPQRSVITRALGTDPNVDVDTFSFQARPGDVFLLCSDGLTSMVDGATITELVERNRLDLPAAARALIKAANDRGGEDNITTVLFAVDGVTGEQPAAPAAVPEPDQDEEDTLHPEDHVPAITEIPAAQALPQETEPQPAEPQAAEPQPAEPQPAEPQPAEPQAAEPKPAEPQIATMVISAAEIEAARAEAAAREQDASPEEAAPEPPSPEETGAQPSAARRLLAAAVIVALVGVIAFLLLKGLTR